jgi:hypothetical protein
MRIALYTSIFGGYDTLKRPWCSQSTDTLRCYTDRPMGDGMWDIVEMEVDADDPVRKARWVKTHPHVLLPEFDITVWVDGSMELKVDLVKLTPEMLGSADIAMYGHPQRRGVYEEAMACIKYGKDDEDIIEQQMSRYREEQMPPKYGLVASGLVIRRNNESTRKLNELWWQEIERGSKRDQLSFDYCRWKTGVELKVIPGSIYDGRLAVLHRYHPKSKVSDG